MNTALPEDITEFGAVAAERFTRFGGPQAALQARPTNTSRHEARVALADLGAFDLDVRSAEDDLLAAAVLCQAAGASGSALPDRRGAAGDRRRPARLGRIPKHRASIMATWPATGSPPISTARDTTCSRHRAPARSWGRFWCRPH